MAARNIIKQMTVAVDGRGYAGNVTEYTPPVLTLATEDHRADTDCRQRIGEGVSHRVLDGVTIIRIMPIHLHRVVVVVFPNLEAIRRPLITVHLVCPHVE